MSVRRNRLGFTAGGVRGESFLCMSRENGSLFCTSQHEFGTRLWPRLVCAAGCFPERAAQGRGTCSRLKQLVRRRAWWVGRAGGRRAWGWNGKMLGGSRKLPCAGLMKPSGRAQGRCIKKTFVLERKTLPVLSG